MEHGGQPDVYFKKLVTLEHAGHMLHLRVAQDLFSSHEIDAGTRFLLRSLAENATAPFTKVLDLGCGYGPLGLTMAKVEPDREVQLVDRDALAIEYARQNAVLNGMPQPKVYGSLGYDDVKDTDFDLVLSNVPGKAGDTVISSLLLDARHHLRPGGLTAIVVVAALGPEVAELLAATPEIEVMLRKSRSGHVVYFYRFAEDGRAARPLGSALDRGVYRRGDMALSCAGQELSVETAHGLPEFDALSFQSQLLLESLSSLKGARPKKVISLNPGQGHLPVALVKLFEPEELSLVGRDLLGLRYAEANLLRNGYPRERITLSHRLGMATDDEAPVDLIVGPLEEDEGREAIAYTVEEGAKALSAQGTMLVAATSTAVTRLESSVQSQELLKIKARKRKGGHSVLELTRVYKMSF